MRAAPKIVVGAVLLLSALAKAYDVQGTVLLAASVYPGLPAPRLVVVVFIGVEIALAGGLLLLRGRAPILAALVFMVGITGVATWGLTSGAPSCGCLGTLVELPPAVTLLKNAVLLGLLAVAVWCGENGTPSPTAQVGDRVST